MAIGSGVTKAFFGATNLRSKPASFSSKAIYDGTANPAVYSPFATTVGTSRLRAVKWPVLAASFLSQSQPFSSPYIDRITSYVAFDDDERVGAHCATSPLSLGSSRSSHSFGSGLPIDAGIDSHDSREISTFWRSFWSASFSKSADSPPQRMSTSGLPFHSTTRPYAIGVPAGIALTFTATFHFSFAYSAKAFRAASWMNFDTGVMRFSSLSIGAGVCARTPLPPAIATRRARADSIIRRVIDCSLGRPGAGAFDRSLPRLVPRGPLVLRHRRRERALDRMALGHRVERAPEADAEPGEIGGAETGRLDDGRPVHRRIEHVGLELAEEVVGDGAAIHAEPRQRRLGVGGHRLQHVAALEGDRLQRGARQMRPRGAAREPENGAACVRIPVRRAEPDEGRHEVHAARVGHRAGQGVRLGGVRDDPEAVAQPLNGGAGDEDGALERIGRPPTEAPGDRRQQPVRRDHRALAGVDEGEAARAVRVLGLARPEARLPEERGLLVARDAGDRHAARQPAEVRRLGARPGRIHERGQHLGRHVEQGAHAVIPVDAGEVQAERARGVADVGGVHAAAGQLPQEPRVDGAEGQLAARGTTTRVGGLVEDPRDLRPGEIGVQHQARAGPHHRLVTLGPQPVADGGGAAALPDDGAMERRAGGAVPDDRRLALVGDADGGEVVSGDARRAQRLPRRALDGRPEVLGIVLHPARPRIVLRDFRVAARAHGAFGVDDECRRAGRPLVEREHEAGRHRSGRLSYGLLKEAGAMRLVRRRLVTLLLLAVPAAGAPPGHAAPEGQLTWAVHFALAPTWFDPAETSGIITPFVVLYALHDAMVKPLPGNPMAPSLAESWSASPDWLVYEFVLRKGVRFHNGEPVTAEDVKFSLERYRGASNRMLRDRVQAIETPDPGRVRIRLKQPWPDFMTFSSIATGAGWIVPKKYVEKVGEDGFKKAPVGAGPYRFVSFTPGVELVLEAFDQYWRRTPNVKRLVLRVIPDHATRLAALKRGDVDVAYAIR